MARRKQVAAIAAAVVYAVMWIGDQRNWAWLAAVDWWLLDALYPIGADHPLWLTSWNVFCTVLGPLGFRIVGGVVIVWLLVRRHLRAALFLLASVEGSALVTEVAKQLADRPRPESAFVHAYGTSFPSGHAVGVMVGVLAFGTLLLPVVAARWRPTLIVVGALIVVLIGVGRVVLNVHHPSDVLAGWALGFLWYLACLRMLPPLPLTTSSAGTPEAPGSGR